MSWLTWCISLLLGLILHGLNVKRTQIYNNTSVSCHLFTGHTSCFVLVFCRQKTRLGSLPGYVTLFKVDHHNFSHQGGHISSKDNGQDKMGRAVRCVNKCCVISKFHSHTHAVRALQVVACRENRTGEISVPWVVPVDLTGEVLGRTFNFIVLSGKFALQPG